MQLCMHGVMLIMCMSCTSKTGGGCAPAMPTIRMRTTAQVKQTAKIPLLLLSPSSVARVPPASCSPNAAADLVYAAHESSPLKVSAEQLLANSTAAATSSTRLVDVAVIMMWTHCLFGRKHTRRSVVSGGGKCLRMLNLCNYTIGSLWIASVQRGTCHIHRSRRTRLRSAQHVMKPWMSRRKSQP
jgi:hypothetical protein